MRESLPSCYTRLGPFRDLFSRGLPILTYHKFGPRPRRARLRGMFLPVGLFRQQLRELRQQEYRVVSLSGGISETADRRVVLTIDDGFRSVHEHALPILESEDAKAMLYLVADRIGMGNDWETAQGEVAAPLMGAEEIKEWLAAGQGIGSHTATHPWLTRLPISALREELRSSRKRLEDQFGVPVVDFCYPYGDWNIVVREEVIAAGYTSATTTDFGVNPGEQDRWLLRRITARHASWGWRRIRAWLGRWRRA